jgi:hypothetical protein
MARPGCEQVRQYVYDETARGTWPEPILRAAAAGELPDWPACEAVIEPIISERMKPAALTAIRARKSGLVTSWRTWT